MANDVVGIDIVARLDRFKAEMSQIPDIGAKEARALTGQLSREIKKAERASRQALQSQRREFSQLKKTLIDTELSLELLKKAYELTAKSIGAVVSRAKELDEALGGELNPAIDQATKAGQRLLDQFVEPLIPGMTDLVDVSRDYFDSIRETGVVGAFATALNDVMSGAALAARELLGLNAEVKQLNALREQENNAIEEQVEKVNALKREIADAQLGDAFAGLGDVAVADVSALTAELERQKDVLRNLRGEINRDRGARAAADAPRRAQEAEEAASREVRAAERAAAGIVAAQEQARRAYMESANARRRAADIEIEESERVARAQQDAIERIAMARERAAEQERELRASLAQIAIGTAVAVADSIVDVLGDLARANTEDAKKRRDVELGLAILRGELQAAGAFGTTLASYGGTPQGFALAAAAAAAVGVQSKAAAAAAYAASAEKFHAGGLAPDEGTRVVRAGEGVLTPAAVRNVGGEAGLRALNSGAAGAGDDGRRTLIIGGRAFDAMVGDALSRRGSVLTRSLEQLRQRPGRHRPHG